LCEATKSVRDKLGFDFNISQPVKKFADSYFSTYFRMARDSS